ETVKGTTTTSKLQDGLSCITGNCYVQFLGEKEAARPPTYPAANVQEDPPFLMRYLYIIFA
ncbi:hypothetical protein, partial [Sulfoacidibacillus ferrooxidans]|uniref:hypothetical protein n=1 Tax=Sulfoacidibacillus ferrooxidans TaxID=2005001 RepID=UPI001F50CEC6